MAGAPDPVPVLMAGSAIVGQVLSPAGYLPGLGAAGAYPGCGTDPLDGFRHLAADLAGPLRGFRDGNHEEFQRARHAAAEWLRTKPRLP
jgi:hypothetical protein